MRFVPLLPGPGARSSDRSLERSRAASLTFTASLRLKRLFTRPVLTRSSFCCVRVSCTHAFLAEPVRSPSRASVWPFCGRSRLAPRAVQRDTEPLRRRLFSNPFRPRATTRRRRSDVAGPVQAPPQQPGACRSRVRCRPSSRNISRAASIRPAAASAAAAAHQRAADTAGRAPISAARRRDRLGRTPAAPGAGAQRQRQLGLGRRHRRSRVGSG